MSNDKSLGLGFVAAGKATRNVVALPSNVDYAFEWWNVGAGGWLRAVQITTDGDGVLNVPDKPDDNGWAFRIRRALMNSGQ